MQSSKNTVVQVVIYDSDTGEIKPDGLQTITQKMFDDLVLPAGTLALIHKGLAHPDYYKVDTVQAPHILVPYTKPVDLVVAKREAKAHIDWKAAKMRSLVGSHGYGQEMVYLAKEDEARRFIEDLTPIDTDYPMLSAEVGITGIDMSSVAVAVMAKSTAWRAFASTLEKVRLGTKSLINEAVDLGDIQAACDAVVWPNFPQ